MAKLLLKVTANRIYNPIEDMPSFKSKKSLAKFITMRSVVEGEEDWEYTETEGAQAFTLHFINRSELLGFLEYE